MNQQQAIVKINAIITAYKMNQQQAIVKINAIITAYKGDEYELLAELCEQFGARMDAIEEDESVEADDMDDDDMDCPACELPNHTCICGD